MENLNSKRKLSVILLGALVFSSCSGNRSGDGPVALVELEAVAHTITAQDGKIVYSGWDKTVNIFDLATKEKTFTAQTIDLCYAKPVVAGERIYYAESDRAFVCASLPAGDPVWKLPLKGRCSRFDFIGTDMILLSIKNHGLVAIDKATGSVRYELAYRFADNQLPDLSPWKVSSDRENMYISNWQGAAMVCFRKKDGHENWRIKPEPFGLSGAAVVLGDKLFFGINESYNGGKLVLAKTSSGEILSEIQCNYEERLDPMVYQDKIYFYSFDKYLNQYDASTGKNSKMLSLQDSDPSGSQMFLHDGQIYFSDNSFFLNRIDIGTARKERLEKLDKLVLGMGAIDGKPYFIY